MTLQPWTIYIKKTNHGYISFDTEEDAKAWLNEPDDDGVKWPVKNTRKSSPKRESHKPEYNHHLR